MRKLFVAIKLKIENTKLELFELQIIVYIAINLHHI